jgi:PAS domain-containing protein
LLSHPRTWAILFLCPVLVLLLVLASLNVSYYENAVGRDIQTAAIAAAVIALGTVGIVLRRFYRGTREIRNFLFKGDYGAALEAARRWTTAGIGLGFESALERLLEFDRRRAERVAASTRLLDCLLREVPVPILIGNLEDNLIRFNRPMCNLLDAADERYSLMALLLIPANRPFAALWEEVVSGEKTRAEAILTLHLPVRQTARQLDVQLFAVQDDEGLVTYVFGLARPSDASPSIPPVQRTTSA